MGGFDLFCNICELPFEPFHNPTYKQKTKWLNYAICEYSKDGIMYKIPVKNYDGYGKFEIIGDLPEALKNDEYFMKEFIKDEEILIEQNGKYFLKKITALLTHYVLLTPDMSYVGDMYHSACANRKDKDNLIPLKEFTQQWFDQDGFLKDKDLLWLLNEPEQINDVK